MVHLSKTDFCLKQNSFHEMSSTASQGNEMRVLMYVCSGFLYSCVPSPRPVHRSAHASVSTPTCLSFPSLAHLRSPDYTIPLLAEAHPPDFHNQHGLVECVLVSGNVQEQKYNAK